MKGAGVADAGNSDSAWWTTGEAADFLADLGVTRQQVARLVARGRLRALRAKPHGWARIDARAVREYRCQLLAQLAGQDLTSNET